MQRRLTFLFGCCLVLGACATATVDKQSVRATQTAPESTQVEVVRIPYDPALPYYVVTVEPLTFAAEQPMSGAVPARRDAAMDGDRGGGAFCQRDRRHRPTIRLLRGCPETSGQPSRTNSPRR
ncbi:hypothetical protein MELA_01067 [Candidatus Methylomirabilis lanthanidiphila]|uniref:Lipoprotein n=1 Tax=Candidatus Methylomirabilis lanthanidiphila TaxID=2211376 RepID=A0A564ZHQ3_9BACT|nr:hypothetical protein MELA_01067 [Candidatus Methylomirabilis lanthanidiphila]